MTLVAFACNSGLEHSSETSTVASVSTPLEESKEAIHWPTSNVLLYELEMSSHVSLIESESATEMRLTGNVEAVGITIPGAKSATALFLRVADPRLQVPGTPDTQFSEIIKELSVGCLVEFEGTTIKALRLPTAHSEVAKTLFQTLGSYFQMGAPFKRLATGETDGRDSTGQYRLKYSELGSASRFALKKTSYVPVRLNGKFTSRLSVDIKPEVISSEGTVDFASDRIETLTYREELRSDLLNSGSMVAKNSAKLVFRSQSAPNSPLISSELVSQWPRVDTEKSLKPTADRDTFDVSKIGNFTFESALRELVANASTGSSNEPAERSKTRVTNYNRAFSALSALLHNSESLSKAERHIRSGGSSSNALLQALAATDTPDAQRLLVTLVESGKLTPSLRQTGILSLMRVEHPSSATITSLLEWLDIKDLHTYAIYGLGTLSRRLRESGDEAMSSRASAALGEQLTRSTDRAERVHALRGIANSGDPKLFETLLPLTSDPDDTIRGAAFEAMRLMPRPEVDVLLAERLPSESSHFALRAELNAAKARTPSATLAQALTSVAKTSTDTQSRYRAVKLMASWRNERPELAPILAQVAVIDASEDVRAAAASTEVSKP
jgi:hypothetical protein